MVSVGFQSGGVGLRSGEFEHPWIGRRIAFRDPKEAQRSVLGGYLSLPAP